MPDSKSALLAMAVAVGASLESGALDAQVPEAGAWAVRRRTSAA